jgi:hypothetical protein
MEQTTSISEAGTSAGASAQPISSDDNSGDAFAKSEAGADIVPIPASKLSDVILVLNKLDENAIAQPSGERIPISGAVAQWCTLIYDMFDSFDSAPESAVEIPVTATIATVSKFVDFINELAKGSPRANFSNPEEFSAPPEWMVNFITGMSIQQCCELIDVANAMGQAQLYNLAAWYASQILDVSSAEAVRAQFGITEHGFTEEELKRNRYEQLWLDLVNEQANNIDISQFD